MMVNSSPDIPDYALADKRIVTAPHELKAMAHPLRAVILDLVLERAATITELANALERPKSTVAHHVSVLVEADMLTVVRTRRVVLATGRDGLGCRTASFCKYALSGVWGATPKIFVVTQVYRVCEGSGAYGPQELFFLLVLAGLRPAKPPSE